MSSEIERELEQLFAQLPAPDPEVEERALAAALTALQPRQPRPRRRVQRLAILVAAALVLLALAAGALAAAGALHVSFGRQSHHPSKTANAGGSPQLQVPVGAHGIAAVIDGRLWLTTRSGLRLQGLPVSTAALSPHALYVAAGIGNSLVAMAPDGRRAWSHPTGGTVAAIAWAPDGLRIAYIVHTGRHFRLHVIVGNGTHDHTIDRGVRAVQPSWRADSLALAYVAGGGKPVIYDLGHHSRRVISAPTGRDATRLAFAPSGSALAIATRNGFLLAGAGGRPNGGSFKPSLIGGIGWLNGQIAVAVNPAYPGDQGPFVQLFTVEHGEAIPMGQLIPPAPIKALDTENGRLTIAVAASDSLRVLSSSPGTPTRKLRLARAPAFLTLPPSSRIGSLAVR
jgi:hypothetical protein